MADRVIVAVFASQNQAYDAARYVQNLDKDGIIQLKRGAIASKDAKGNLTIPDTKGVGAASGGILGGTVDLGEFGLSEDFIDDVSNQLNPGETALIAEVDEDSTESIDRIVALHGGRVYRSEVV